MRGAAETKQVTTLTLSMTPQEAKNLATAADFARVICATRASHENSAPALIHMAEMERLIAALGMGLANCPRGDE